MPSIAERLATLSLKGDDSPHLCWRTVIWKFSNYAGEGLTNAEIAERPRSVVKNHQQYRQSGD